MALPGEVDWIGKACPDCGTPLTAAVRRSAAGWFVATVCDRCYPYEIYSRESDYHPSREACVAAVRAGTVRWRGAEPSAADLAVLAWVTL